MTEPLKSVVKLCDSMYMVVCECIHDDHNLTIHVNVDDNLVTLFMKPSFLPRQTFIQRIKHAWRYIIKGEADLEHEIILDKEAMQNTTELFKTVTASMKDV